MSDFRSPQCPPDVEQKVTVGTAFQPRVRHSLRRSASRSKRASLREGGIETLRLLKCCSGPGRAWPPRAWVPLFSDQGFRLRQQGDASREDR